MASQSSKPTLNHRLVYTNVLCTAYMLAYSSATGIAHSRKAYSSCHLVCSHADVL